jgi:hypothetical protein
MKTRALALKFLIRIMATRGFIVSPEKIERAC